MARYRDDTQETAVAGDSTFGRMIVMAEEVAKVVATLIVGLTFVISEQATAADYVEDRSRYLFGETATLSDTVIDARHGKELVTEVAKALDSVRHEHLVLHQDSAVASDSVSESLLSMLNDSALVVDQVIGQRKASTLVVEQVRARDTAFRHALNLNEDSVAVSDSVHSRLHANTLVIEAAQVTEQLQEGTKAPTVTTEQAVAASFVIDHLHAANLVIESLIADDEIPGSNGYGQTWTANSETWAMSRYNPYAFHSLAVINGVGYGLADDGVYLLTGGTDAVIATITTGKLDLGNGQLVHPLAAYLEYELEGTASMDVTTTQTGTAQTYTYALAAEPAGQLTNGRFIFGRGLRGRHFAFSLRMTGQHGYINDLNIETASTTRRT